MFDAIRIGIVVPAFNEEKLIHKTLSNIPKYAKRIYVTDDASNDHTADKVKALIPHDRRLMLIQHRVNQGVGGAILSGFKQALEEDMDIVVVMAGDNQMDSKYLPVLLGPILENRADFTKANRLRPSFWRGMSPFRLFGNVILTFINKIVTGYWFVTDPQNGYIAISIDCLRKIDLDTLNKGYNFENDLMLKANLANIRIKNVLIPAKYGQEKSKIKYLRFISNSLRYFTKAFYWRLWKKYFRPLHPIGALFLFGSVSFFGSLIAAGILGFAALWPLFLFSFVVLLSAFLSDGLSTLKK